VDQRPVVLLQSGGVCFCSFHVARCSHQRVRNGPAAAAGLLSLASDAAPGHRAGGGYVPCSRRCVRSGGQPRQQARHFVRARQRPRPGSVYVLRSRQRVRKGPAATAGLLSLTSDAAPGHRAAGVTGSAPVSACEQGPAASAGLAPLTSVAAPFTWMWVRTARPSARAKGASSASRPFTSCERRRARPSGRWRLRAGPPSVHTKRDSSFSRPDFSYERCSALVPDVSTCSAAVSSFVYSGSGLAPPISVADLGGGGFVIRSPRIGYQPALAVWWGRHPYSCQHVCIECRCRQASDGWWNLGLRGVAACGIRRAVK